MKHYPKTYEDRYNRPSEVVVSKIGAKDESLDSLIIKTRDFYREVNSTMFDLLVKAVWLRYRFSYDGKSLRSINRNGFIIDTAFAFFMRGMVGYSHKLLIDSGNFYKIYSYFNEFFPEFLQRDPFKEPEYFAFPYKYVSIDHLILVYECDERMEMLEYAEKNAMNIRDFTNWVVNWAYCYNDDVGKKVYRYSDTFRDRRSPSLRKIIRKKK